MGICRKTGPLWHTSYPGKYETAEHTVGCDAGTHSASQASPAFGHGGATRSTEPLASGCRKRGAGHWWTAAGGARRSPAGSSNAGIPHGTPGSPCSDQRLTAAQWARRLPLVAARPRSDPQPLGTLLVLVVTGGHRRLPAHGNIRCSRRPRSAIAAPAITRVCAAMVWSEDTRARSHAPRVERAVPCVAPPCPSRFRCLWEHPFRPVVRTNHGPGHGVLFRPSFSLTGRSGYGPNRPIFGADRVPFRPRPCLLPWIYDLDPALTAAAVRRCRGLRAPGVLLRRPASLPRLLVEAFAVTLVVIATFWLGMGGGLAD